MKTSLLVVAFCLLASAATAQTCDERWTAIRTQVNALRDKKGYVTVGKIATLNAALDAFKASGCIALPPPPAPITGFTASYWNTTTPGVIPTTPPTLLRIDTDIDFDWGNGSPDSSITPDNFAVRWTKTGTFNDGTYLFTVRCDDGARLWIDGALVIDAWTDHAPTDYTGTKTLLAGAHAITLEYYEHSGAAVVQLTWAQQTGTMPVGFTGVAWDASPDPAVTGYLVSMGTQSGVYTSTVDVGAALVYQPANLVSGTRYYFVVQVYDGAGNRSDFSTEVSAVR